MSGRYEEQKDEGRDSSPEWSWEAMVALQDYIYILPKQKIVKAHLVCSVVYRHQNEYSGCRSEMRSSIS